MAITRDGFILRRLLHHFFRATLACAQSEALEGELGALERAVSEFRVPTHLTRLPYSLGVLAEFLARPGRLGDTDATIRAALASAEAKDERWSMPELLRIRAYILAAQGRPDEAEALLIESMAIARGIGSVSGPLASTIELARPQSSACPARQPAPKARSSIATAPFLRATATSERLPRLTLV